MARLKLYFSGKHLDRLNINAHIITPKYILKDFDIHKNSLIASKDDVLLLRKYGKTTKNSVFSSKYLPELPENFIPVHQNKSYEFIEYNKFYLFYDEFRYNKRFELLFFHCDEQTLETREYYFNIFGLDPEKSISREDFLKVLNSDKCNAKFLINKTQGKIVGIYSKSIEQNISFESLIKDEYENILIVFKEDKVTVYSACNGLYASIFKISIKDIIE